ncbi:MAG: T9SS type A sorting domain-containing protein [candidate division WOR-3 bacterium]
MINIVFAFFIFNPDNFGNNKIQSYCDTVILQSFQSYYHCLSDSLFWDFESSNGGFIAHGFSPYPGGWVWDSFMPWTQPHSGHKAWFMTSDWFWGLYEDNCSWILESPVIVLNSAGACTLSFYHWYNIEWWFDGGNLKISTDYGATWAIIYPLEPDSYPCPSAHNGNFGIPNEPCFSGDSSNLGWHLAKFLLDNYAGKIVILRWHFGSDPADVRPGWYIDDVKITNATGITRDVGTSSILRPVINVIPNVILYPLASYQNYGIDNANFKAFFQIDSLNTTIYIDSINISLPPQAETILTFNPWRTGNNSGITYGVSAYVKFFGDQYPLNDTVKMFTQTSQQFWEVLLKPFPLPSSGHSLAAHSDTSFMVFGIHIPGQYLDTTLVYITSRETWHGGPKNPFGPGSYGTVNFVNGKFYRIGGTNDFPNPLNRVDIYDPVSNLWTSGSPAPVGLIDQTSGVYKDSLIYIFGNGNWGYPTSNEVFIYDTYHDIWLSANPFPGTGRGTCAGGIIDSFIIIAGGFKTGGVFCSDYIVGKISSTNPTLITWGQWQAIPGMDSGRCRIPYTIDNLNKELWLLGGKLANALETGEVWSYNPYTNIWTNWQMQKPNPVCNVGSVVVAKTCYGNRGIFIPSGYHTNTYVREHELLHLRNQGAEEQKSFEMYTKCAYLQCLPNPARKFLKVKYQTTNKQDIQIKVFDASGRFVKMIVNRKGEIPGEKIAYWNLCDENGKTIPAGVYFIHLETSDGNMLLRKKVIKLK